MIVHIKLSNDSMGTEKERKDLQALEERLESAINAKRAGEFDGNEYGEGFCTLYMYGPDANALFASVEPGLRAAGLPKGSYVIKRFGSADDRQAREERIDFSR